MTFPLYVNDGVAACKLSEFQEATVRVVRDKIITGRYRLVDNACLCLNERHCQDIVVSQKDRYGLPIPTVLCSKCGLVRSGSVFDSESNSRFYMDDYRSMYVGSKTAPDLFFDEQIARGSHLLRIVRSAIPPGRVRAVFEVGCGAGGVLYPFHQAGYCCSGVDFDNDYLDHGRSRGLHLLHGDWDGLVQSETVDLLLLSHVFEHFTHPVEEMQKLIPKVTPGGFMVVAVPGIFSIHKTYFQPLLYFQNAHVFNYHYQYLKLFFEKMGLRIIFGDERCEFVLQKPTEWESMPVHSIYDSSLDEYVQKTQDYLVATEKMYRSGLNVFMWRHRLSSCVQSLGVKRYFGNLLRITS